MKAFAVLATALFGALGLCSVAGGMIGVVAGTFFGLVMPAAPPQPLAMADVVRAGLMLGFSGWLVVVMVIGVWLRFGVLAVAVPGVINAILTGILTVYVNDLIRIPVLAVLIGLAIGILVGALLCWFCRRRSFG